MCILMKICLSSSRNLVSVRQNSEDLASELSSSSSSSSEDDLCALKWPSLAPLGSPPRPQPQQRPADKLEESDEGCGGGDLEGLADRILSDRLSSCIPSLLHPAASLKATSPSASTSG